jgi:hypothetical protein
MACNWIDGVYYSPDDPELDDLLREQNMRLTDKVNHAETILHMIDDLTWDEGSGVEIVNDSPDFGGFGCMVLVRRRCFESVKRYYGDSLLECLQKATEDM